MTHTFAKLEVSESTYKEIEKILKEAGYQHAFIEDTMDMSGIGLKKKKETSGTVIGIAQEKIEPLDYVSVDSVSGKLRKSIQSDVQ